MAEPLLTEICIALIIFALLILIQRKSIIARPALLAVFFAVFFIDNLLIVLTNRFSSLTNDSKYDLGRISDLRLERKTLQRRLHDTAALFDKKGAQQR